MIINYSVLVAFSSPLFLSSQAIKKMCLHTSSSSHVPPPLISRPYQCALVTLTRGKECSNHMAAVFRAPRRGGRGRHRVEASPGGGGAGGRVSLGNGGRPMLNSHPSLHPCVLLLFLCHLIVPEASSTSSLCFRTGTLSLAILFLS